MRDIQINQFGQQIGFALPEWVSPQRPERVSLEGRFARVEPLDATQHAIELFEAHSLDQAGKMWTYLGYGPFAHIKDYSDWAARASESSDPLFFAIVDLRTGHAVGTCAYMRIDAANGVMEIGHLAYSPLLQRSPVASEAMFLLMKHAFELGYRRYEWKCDALNQASRKAAKRLGFTYEGTFRQAIVYKGRNRDTAWFSIIDSEWPALKAAYETWLDSANFDDQGRQIQRLSDLTAAALGKPQA